MGDWTKEDYSAFSWVSIQKSFEDIIADVKKQTGCSDEELNAALAVAAKRFMNINCFLLEGGDESKQG